ncbi:MAG: DUF5615 family PIN-like protein [Vulcanimicrobiaceae bacterium]
MRLLIDENCAERDFLARLRNAGHDVMTTVGALGVGASDAAIIELALAENRTVVTKDADDFRRQMSAHAEHAGLLLIYEDQHRLRRSAAALASAIDNVAAIYPSARSYIIPLYEFMW